MIVRVFIVLLFTTGCLCAAPGQSQPKVTDLDLQTFSEALLKKDSNNAAKYITINYQAKTHSSTSDEAPEPLLTIEDEAYNISTVAKVRKLFDNYIANASQAEVVTAEETREEEDLLTAFVDTSVMKHTRQFLKDKGKIGPDEKDFKNLLRTIWFTLHPRGNRRLSSSAFEHVFLGEIKQGEVSGFHNWIYFGHEEAKKHVNYMGYVRAVEFGTKGAILKLHYKWDDYVKPVSSMFIGTSPELEMALYTVCFLTRPNELCRLKMSDKVFHVKVYSFKYKGKNIIGSAYPVI